MSVKLLTGQHLEFLRLTEGCTGSSEFTHVKMPHVTAHMYIYYLLLYRLSELRDVLMDVRGKQETEQNERRSLEKAMQTK